MVLETMLVQDNSGRLSHVVPIRSEELDAYGAVGIFYLCVPAVSLPCLENSFRRDEFRYHYIHSKLLGLFASVPGRIRAL